MDFSFLSDPRYNVIGAFWMTVQLTFWSAIGAFILGVILAAMRVCPVPLMRGFAGGVVNIVRNIPLTLIIIMMSQVIANQLGLKLAVREAGVNPQGYLDTQNFRLAVLGFIIYTSTFVCEAIRAVVAPLGSVLIALTKNTTVASAIGVSEAALLMNTLIENEADKFTAVFIVIAAGFIVLTLPTGSSSTPWHRRRC